MFGCNNNKGEGNIGIVELLISKQEEKIKGCNFHESKLDYFNENISSDTHECTLHAYENDIIGFNCLETTHPNEVEVEVEDAEIYLQPENCFNNVYKGLNSVDITTILKNAQTYNINNKKTPTFLKIPPYNLLEDVEISCQCTIKQVVKKIKVIITKNDTVLLKREVQSESTLDDKIYKCEHENFINPRVNKTFDENVEYTCNIKIENFFNYIQIFCPAKDRSNCFMVSFFFEHISLNLLASSSSFMIFIKRIKFFPVRVNKNSSRSVMISSCFKTCNFLISCKLFNSFFKISPGFT